MHIEGIPWTIAEKIARKEETGCWIHEGQKTSYGYPKYTTPDRKTGYIHVLVWEAVTGREKGKEFALRRTCGDTSCVNPDHMILVRYNYRPLNTHCKRGHELTEDNVYYQGKHKRRECKKCVQERQAKYREARR